MSAAADVPPGLRACAAPLRSSYDVAMLDLDGVVYVGRQAVPGAPAALAAARDAGMRLAFVTNNASRTPATVAAHLRDLGVPATGADVVTSAQAAAGLVNGRVPPGSRVFVIGGEGLVTALAERGLEAVQRIEDDPAAVVSGYAPDLRWRTVIDGAILVRRGLPWVASNTDLTVPTPHGPGPGNGVLVGAVASFAGVTPVVAGKPEPPLFQETVDRVGAHRPLVVGDRLDTDIEGARRAGYDSLLVMTGVTGPAELVGAAPGQRPSYVAADLTALQRPAPVPHDHAGGARLGGWTAEVRDGRLLVLGGGQVDDWWRTVAACGWRHRDQTGEIADVGGLAVPQPPSAGERR